MGHQGGSVMSTEDEVRKASRQFYAGLNRMVNGDAEPLAGIWSRSAAVTAMHPIGGRQVGWDAVRTSFEQVAKLASGGKVELKDQLIHVVGDVAYEAGVEYGQIRLAGQQVTIEHRVTNIYQREAGVWKMTHHHTDTSPEMLDVLSRLEPRSAKAG
jgi:ketosteroid isomerase-like protein